MLSYSIIRRFGRNKIVRRLLVGSNSSRPYGVPNTQVRYDLVRFTPMPHPERTAMTREDLADYAKRLWYYNNFKLYTGSIHPWVDTDHNIRYAFPRNLQTILKMYTPYRVCYHEDTNRIEVAKVSEKAAPEIVIDYYGYEQLPEWIQRKLSVLQLIAVEEYGEDIEGVGCVLDKGTYWVYDSQDT